MKDKPFTITFNAFVHEGRIFIPIPKIWKIVYAEELRLLVEVGEEKKGTK